VFVVVMLVFVVLVGVRLRTMSVFVRVLGRATRMGMLMVRVVVRMLMGVRDRFVRMRMTVFRHALSSCA